MTTSERLTARETNAYHTATNQQSTEKYQSAKLRKRTTNVASEASLATGKGALSFAGLGNSAGLGSSAGLGDPFAEIFAAIASAEAPPPPNKPVAERTDEPRRAERDTEVSSDEANEENPASETASIIIDPDVPLHNELTDASETLTDNERVAQNLVGQEQESDQQSGGEPETLLSQQDTAESDAIDSEAVSANQEATQQEVDPDAPETAVETEATATASQSDKRDRNEQGTEVAVESDLPIEGSDESPELKVAEPAKTEQTQDDSQGEDETNAQRAVQTKDPVQRRRYSDPQNDSGSGDADEAVAAKNASTELASTERSHSSPQSRSSQSSLTQGGGSGIDISSLTPVANAAQGITPATVATGAVAAASRSAAVSASSSTASNSASFVNRGETNAPPTHLESGARTSSTDSSDSSRQAKSVAGTDTLSAVQRAKLVQRVSRGFQHLGASGGQIRMRLSPHELGSVQLQLQIQNGELSGRMVTETEAASQALREQLPQLRSTLESQGIRVERLDIHTEAAADSLDAESSGQKFGDASGQSRGDGFTRQQEAANSRQRSGWPGVRATKNESPNVAPEARHWPGQNKTGVDLRA